VAGLGTMAPRSNATILQPPTVIGSAPEFSAGFVPGNTVDQTQLEYASAGQGVNTFIEYSFGTPQTFDKIVVINRDSAGPSDYIGNFTLTFDGGATASVSRTPIRGVSQIHSLGTPRTATTVRLDVDTVGAGTSNNTGAMEVFFVRTPVGQTPVSASIFGSAPAFAPLYAADNAVDGDIGRSTGAGLSDGPEYASASQGVETFVDFDLGGVVPVGGFDYFDRPHVADRVTGFDMIFSVNSTFGDGDDILKSYSNPGMATGDVFAPVAARFVRFDVTATSGSAAANTGVSEMVFYQVPEPSAAVLLGFGLLAAARKRRP